MALCDQAHTRSCLKSQNLFNYDTKLTMLSVGVLVQAEMLARYARHDPKLLSPIQHRSEDAQLDLAMIRVRERLVVARTMLINATRGLVKCFGHRLRACSADYVAQP